jgi:hypothetical protein
MSAMRAPWMRRSVASVLATAFLSAPLIAFADPTPEDKAAATTLFKQGRELMEAKRWSEACRKLEESQRLDPGGGTLLNVGVRPSFS